MRLAPHLVLAVAAALVAALSAGAQELALTPAERPSAPERERVERWHRAWREEVAPLERAMASVVALARRPGRPDLRRPCLALGRALLDLDRERVLPAPDPAADLHLRRGLRALTRAAITCLTDRPYAARHAVSEGAGSFRQMRAILARYDLGPEERP